VNSFEELLMALPELDDTLNNLHEIWLFDKIQSTEKHRSDVDSTKIPQEAAGPRQVPLFNTISWDVPRNNVLKYSACCYTNGTLLSTKSDISKAIRKSRP